MTRALRQNPRPTRIALLSVGAGMVCIPAFISVRSPNDFVNLMNGATALVVAGLVALRLISGGKQPILATAWIAAFAAMEVLAVTELSEGRVHQLELRLNIEQIDDAAFLLVFPLSAWIALHRDGTTRAALLLLFGGAVVQSAATGLDLANDWIQQYPGSLRDPAPVGIAELIFLQLYLLAFTLHTFAKVGTSPQPRPDRTRIRKTV